MRQSWWWSLCFKCFVVTFLLKLKPFDHYVPAQWWLQEIVTNEKNKTKTVLSNFKTSWTLRNNVPNSQEHLQCHVGDFCFAKIYHHKWGKQKWKLIIFDRIMLREQVDLCTQVTRRSQTRYKQFKWGTFPFWVLWINRQKADREVKDRQTRELWGNTVKNLTQSCKLKLFLLLLLHSRGCYCMSGSCLREKLDWTKVTPGRGFHGQDDLTSWMDNNPAEG